MDTIILFVDIVFLIVIAVFFVLLVASVIFHLKARVPFVPTPRRVINAMVTLGELRDGQLVYDLGAGDGRVLTAAKRRCPGIRAIGYEGAIGVWVLARIRQWFSRSGVDIRRENFLRVDLSGADVIFLYLCIDALRLLVPKLQQELRPGTLIVSHAFRLPGMQPDLTHEVPMLFGGTTKVHVYRWE